MVENSTVEDAGEERFTSSIYHYVELIQEIYKFSKYAMGEFSIQTIRAFLTCFLQSHNIQ